MIHAVQDEDAMAPFPAATRNHRSRPQGELTIREEEDALTDYMCAIAHTPLLSADEERALFARMQAGDTAARTQLIEANVRLVISIARTYVQTGVPLLDLIQYGNIGLMRAIDGFDLARGTRLSTYAYWWIHAEIRRSLPDELLIRVPDYQYANLARLRQVRYTLARTLGGTPTPEELAEASGLRLPVVNELLHISVPMRSLDMPLRGEEALTLGQSLLDTTEDVERQTLAALHLHTQRQVIAHVCQDFTERERTVIALHYGLFDAPQCTLAEIGQRLGVTRERVRQIEQRALAKMRRRALLLPPHLRAQLAE